MDDQLIAFDKSADKVLKRVHRVGEELGQALVDSFVSKLGKPHPGWAPLSQVTQQERIKQGYSADQPLLRSGVTRDCFTHVVDVEGTVLTIIAGIKSNTIRTLPYENKPRNIGQLMSWHEVGTAREPPRPVLPLVAQDLTRMLHEIIKTGHVSIMEAHM